MFIFKIVGPVLLILAGLFQFFIDHIWTDRRTKSYKNARKIYIGIVILAGIFSIITISVDHTKSKDTISYLTTLKKTADSTLAISEIRELEAKQDRSNLLKNIESLRQKLNPFIALAQSKYPNLETDDALRYLRQDLQELKNKTDNLQKQTTQLEKRVHYTNLLPQFRTRIIVALKEVLEKNQGQDIKINVIEEMGNRARHQLCEEIISILKEAGFKNINHIGQQSYWRGSLTALKFLTNENCENLARNLFSPFINQLFLTKPDARFDSNLQMYEFTIHLVGEPLFNSNGCVSFE